MGGLLYLGWEVIFWATRAAKEDRDVNADVYIPSRGVRVVVLVPSRELEEHRRRFETPVQDRPSDDAVCYLR